MTEMTEMFSYLESKNKIQSDNPEPMSDNRCLAALEQITSRCNFLAIADSDFCLLHIKKANLKKSIDVVDFNDIDKVSNKKKIENIFHKFDFEKKLNRQKNIADSKPKTTDNIIEEEQVDNVIAATNEDNNTLETKLLILSNDDEYADILPTLLGPGFSDITKSDEQFDPVTYDEFWSSDPNNPEIRVPGTHSKYYTFSYLDDNNKIIMFSIYTIYSIITSGKYQHPVTTKNLPEEAIQRATQLIDIYKNKLGLFAEDDNNNTLEFQLKKRINNLFMKFHKYSIYLEDKWLLQISSVSNLEKIAKDTQKLFLHNKGNIQSDNIFTQKLSADLLEAKKYIVGQWEIIDSVFGDNNQLPAWIIAGGMMAEVPEIKEKYPSLDTMIQ